MPNPMAESTRDIPIERPNHHRPKWLTIEQAARVTGESRESIAARVATGELSHAHFSVDGVDLPLIDEAELLGGREHLTVQRR